MLSCGTLEDALLALSIPSLPWAVDAVEKFRNGIHVGALIIRMGFWGLPYYKL